MKKAAVILLMLLGACEDKLVCDQEERFNWLKECYKFSASYDCNIRAKMLFCRKVEEK